MRHMRQILLLMAIRAPRRRTSVFACLVLAATTLASCTQSSSPPVRHHQSPPTSSSAAPSTSKHVSAVARCRAHAGAHGHVVSFRGTHSQSPYCAVVWSSDVIHNCAKHAYGRKMIAFLRKHHCRSATRTLATVFHAHFAVNVSSVATAFPGTAHNQFGAEFKFTQLAKTRSAGGIDDLLRDGHRIPGPAGTPPKHAVYGVYPLNTMVDVLYAWYAGYRSGPTPGLPPSLKTIEQDIAFTPATA